MSRNTNKAILLNHYDVLSAFKDFYYMDLITKEHLGDETVIKINDEQTFVFPVKYKGKLFAIPSKIIEANKLPIKIQNSKKIGFSRNVYHYVTKYASAKIAKKKEMDFRTLVDKLAQFKHTNQDDFTLYKITMLMLYLRKGFTRIVSEAAFGKNSIPTILKMLMTDVAIINPRSTAAFEHKLMNGYVVLDELTNLAKSQRDIMQEALLRVGDWSPTYEKGTRGSSKLGTKDEYDIGKLSISILYNIYDYYIEANQQDKYFDNVFQHAVKDRYLPLLFDGVLDTTQFIDIENPKQLGQQYADDIKKFIRTIKYYETFLDNEVKNYKLFKNYRLSKSGRVDKTFKNICIGINLYAKDEIEYNKLVGKLYDAYERYNNMLKVDEIEEIGFDEPIKPETKQDGLGSFI